MTQKPTNEELVKTLARLEQLEAERGRLVRMVEQLERSLNDSEEKFRLLFDRMPLSYQSLDRKGNFLDINQAWLNTLGYRREEVLGRNFADFLLPGWVDHFHENFPRFQAAGEVTGVEFELRRKDGSAIRVEFNGKIGRDRDGNFLQTHCIFNDITAKKRSEAALAESEQRLRVIFENSPLGMIRIDSDGAILDCNEQCAALMGTKPEQLLGLNLAREGSPNMREAVHKALSGEASVYEGASTSVSGGKTTFLRAVFNPVTPGRSPSTVIATVEDIAKRRLAEEVIERRILSLTRPLADASGIVFEDLFDIDDIQRLQDEFSRATGVASVITRIDGTPLTRPSNFTRLCARIIRKTEKGRANCYASDAALGRMSTAGPLVQPCLSGGLWDAGAGIAVEGRHVANWLIGQVRDETQTEEQMRRYAREIGADEEDFIAAFREVPAMSRRHFDDIAQVLFSLANRLSSTAYQNVQQARFITAIKDAQEQLRKSEDRLRFALEGANDGLWDANLLTGETYLSRRSYEILGYAEGEMTGVFENWRNLVHPDDLATTWERLVAHFKRQTPMLQVELRVRMKDGRWKWLLTRGKVVEWGADGRARRMVGTNTDISEGKKIEETQLFLLRCSPSPSGENILEDLARFLAENLPMDFVCISRMTEDKLALRSEVFYYDGQFQEPMTYVLRNGPCGDVLGKPAASWENNVRRRYPEDAMLEEMAAESYVGATLWNAAGKVIGLISTVGRRPLAQPALAESIIKLVAIRAAAELERRDAEQEKAHLQSQLLQSQKMESVGRLAGGVAHDFNNMLGVILGHVDLAQDQIDPADPLYEDLNEVKKAAQRSADLTRQLLAFARKQTVSPKIIDLNETVEVSFKMLRRLIGEDIDLVWKPGAELWRVKIDPSQVDQILANLLVNARDAIDGVGTISIETGNMTFTEDFCAEHLGFSPGRYVTLSLSDTGCGMSREVREHIFEPFYTTKGVGRGTGLGLATVYGIVKQNNGFINVYSEPGQGTTIRISLPCHEGAAEGMAIDGKSQEPSQGVETILLVEDEASILHLGKRMLERLGYRVLAAGSPSEALRLAEMNAGGVDLLVTDVVMPEMNGRDLARRLLTRHPALKRLFMSGYTADVIAHHGVLDPGVHFIQKPFSKDELAAKVREALDGRRP